MSVIDQVTLSKMPLIFTFPCNPQMVPSDLIAVMLQRGTWYKMLSVHHVFVFKLYTLEQKYVLHI